VLQTAAAPAWRTALAWTHGISGTLFFGVLLGHLLGGRTVRDER